MTIDIERPGALLTYLRSAGHLPPTVEPTIMPLAGGVSNRTMLVEFEDGSGWVVKQALAKLRVAVDWFSSPERIHREALGLRWLTELVPAGSVPAFLFEDEALHIVAMRAVAQPHENWKVMLLRGSVNRTYVEAFGRLLAMIHRGAALRAAELAPIFAEYSFFETLRLEAYYGYAASQVSEAARFLRTLIDETRSLRVTLVHGDFSPKNVLVQRARLVLLDHEVIHWGDPAFDLGFALTHLLSKARHVRAQRAEFIKAAGWFWTAYRTTLDIDLPWVPALEARAVRHTLACLLARVAGRSPLEYLSAQERQEQQAAVIALMHAVPETLPALFERWDETLTG